MTRHSLDCGMCCGLQVCDCGAEPPMSIEAAYAELDAINKHYDPLILEMLERLKNRLVADSHPAN